MKLIINGSVNKYYAETLCMLFFPGAKFSESEETTQDTPVVTISADENDAGVYAYACIKIGDKTEENTVFENYSDGVPHEKTLKHAVGEVMFSVGKSFFGYTPAWGMLTGVRPSKLATGLIRLGMRKDEIKKTLMREYFINPKKASLSADIASTEAKIINTLPEKSCSLYIAIPFCPSRCAYCSFVSYSTERLLSLIPAYLTRVCFDLEKTVSVIKDAGMNIITVYIGGGTPTILTEEQLKTLLTKINKLIDVSALREFTLEAGRPDTITAKKLRCARERGVTRVCINPQTLDDEVLRSIGRKHTVYDFFKSFEVARKSGIKTINTDLIAGLPGEGFTGFSRTVDTVLKLHPENITYHTFCVKKSADILKYGTEIFSRTGGDTGKSVDYSQIKSKIAGYIPYYMYRQKNTVGNFENVGYSLKGSEGLYNIFMMEEVHSIFSVGAGAVTKLVGDGRIERVTMPKYPYEYLAMTEDKISEFCNKLGDYFKKC